MALNATISGMLTPPPASSAAEFNNVLLGLPGLPGTNVIAPIFGQIMSAATTFFPTPTSAGVAILCARGTTLVTDLGGTGGDTGAGYYAIEEWARSIGQQVALAPVLFTGVAISHRDVYSQTLCMNNTKVFYSFGQNFGDVTISGEILLGNVGDKLLANQTVKTFVDFFWKYRVSNSLEPVTVSAVNEKFLTYLVGMDFGEIIPDVHILPFVIHGVLLDVSRNQKDTINTSSAVLTTTDIYNSSIIKALSQTTSVNPITASPTTSVVGATSPLLPVPTNSSTFVLSPPASNINAYAPVITPPASINVPTVVNTLGSDNIPPASIDTGTATTPEAVIGAAGGTATTPAQVAYANEKFAQSLQDPGTITAAQNDNLAQLGQAVVAAQNTVSYVSTPSTPVVPLNPFDVSTLTPAPSTLLPPVF